jgi:hypothetical protein
MSIQRIRLEEPPFDSPGRGWYPGGVWPARWVTHPTLGPGAGPACLWFRLTCPAGKRRLHLAADQRYELFVDNTRVATGSEAGDERHWPFDSFEIHCANAVQLRVRVWWMGALSPLAWHGRMPALLVAAEGDDAINTGSAAWEVQRELLDLESDHVTFGAGGYLRGTTAHNVWPDDGFWAKAVPIPSVMGQSKPDVAGEAINAADDRNTGSPWRLVPSTLPDLVRPDFAGTAVHVGGEPGDPVDPTSHDPARGEQWQALLDGGPAITCDKAETVLVHLDDYRCGIPHVVLAGQGRLTVRWSESLYHSDDPDVSWWARCKKGDRGEIVGKRFFGVGDVFEASDREDEIRPPTWRAGRYLQLRVEPGDRPLVVRSIRFEGTGYPHEFAASFEIEGETGSLLASLEPICRRTLLAGSFDTYMDTPYYERLQYADDTRIECLQAYAQTRDDRLPRQAIRAFARSMLPRGVTRSRYPSTEDQVIPPFCLAFVSMIHDFAMWRDDPAFVKAHLGPMRTVLGAWLDGPPAGWMFCDWDPAFDRGVPPGGKGGTGPIFESQLAIVLRQAADLEAAFGREKLADLYAAEAQRRGRVIVEKYLDHDHLHDGHGVFEHAAIYALLSDDVRSAMPADSAGAVWKRLCDPHAPWDATATAYFSHYLFELCHKQGDLTPMICRLAVWQDMLDRRCLTTLESPGETRSDCHAWTAHPILHALTTVLGVRPASFGFATVRVSPLMKGRCELPHPRGTIRVDATGDGPRLELPPGVEAA